jgi:hypothetical protein
VTFFIIIAAVVLVGVIICAVSAHFENKENFINHQNLKGRF